MTEAPIVRVESVPVPEEATAEFIESFDGATIRLVHFGGPGTRGDVLMVPGWTEPSEKYTEVALDLIDRGFRVHAIDPRGQGMSQRLKEGDERGRIDDFSKHVGDLRAAVDHLGAERLTLLGHSMGGLATLSYLAEGGRADCAILSAPATRIFPSVVQRMGARAAAALLKAVGQGDRPLSPEGGQAMEFEGNTLTSDPERHAMLRDLLLEDERLTLPRTYAHMVAAMHDQHAKLSKEGALDQITVPTVIVSLPDDEWVNPAHHHKVAEACPAHVTVSEIPGAKHEVLMERDEYRDQFWDIFDSHCEAYLPPLSEEST
ncbi:alpha/beta hydrolase [Parvularcula sp. ZS-1/3]|uniref:Alpha/beta hydrolase n=1 Tax=Parvularcula mediterranea TaxID=2732508 RepID=A0A7Y3RLE2_9PROT|nr:alpha/beta hydrolase [Parvularcula mediterranea]NNU15492.1 alpha/beta hydrolase [Parvularcula mediterranea]